MNSSLQLEAQAFDKRVLERVQNGLIPDLRRAKVNDWFYNNPWRRPLYVNMVFGEYFRFINQQLQAPARILEVGSGLGQIALELSREGHFVTGVELSATSVDIANKYKDENPYTERFGSLEYINSDFLSYTTGEKFDAIYFCLTLHHFSNLDSILERCVSMLKDDGKIIVIEPARDLFSRRNASIIAMLRVFLSMTGNWFQKLDVPETVEELDAYTQECLNEYRDAKDKDEDEQSPNDNESYAADMLAALNKYFKQVKLDHGNSIIPRMIGGLRADSDDNVEQMARFLKLFDDFATKENLIEPGVIFYTGTHK